MSTTIENLNGISIKSPFFNQLTSMQLFPNHPKPPKTNRVALIHGRNGSGKSTIANGFREYKSSILSTITEFEIIDNNKKIINFSNIDKEKIFIFDEEYINQKIRIKEKGLDAIVLFGEQVFLEKQIEEIERDIIIKEEEYKKQLIVEEKFNDPNDKDSPLYWKDKIKEILKSDDGWADRGRKIKSQKNNLSVTDAIIDEIGILTVTKPEKDIRNFYNDSYNSFKNVESDSIEITNKVMNYYIDGNIIEDIKKLFNMTIQHPVLTNRENELLKLFGINKLNDTKQFLNEQPLQCHTCLQCIDSDYRLDVLKSIDNILNREYEEFKTKLNTLKLKEIFISEYLQYRNLDVLLYEEFHSVFDNLIELIKKHNELIQIKVDSPFEVLEYDNIDLLNICDSFNMISTKLEEKRIDYNQIITDRKNKENELLDYSKLLAHYEILNEYILLLEQRKEKEKADNENIELSNEIKGLKENKNHLDSQRKNLKIAADEINQSLEYIFYDNNRLRLEYDNDGYYHLSANGQSVIPTNVSCGERNALGLSYFFTEIVGNSDIKSIYINEMLLIIDDPISSFDVENKIGIITFLRWKFEELLINCTTTKILLMTHDINIMFDMQKVFDEVSTYCKENNKNAEYCSFQLNDKKIIKFEHRHFEYTKLLKMVYTYINTPTNESDLTIGNVMRRVLETFATFLYVKGITDLSIDSEILDILPENHRIYYRNLMYRLVLHNESHSEESVKGIPEINFFNTLSMIEKQKTAKDVLCLLYELNQLHIISHIPEAKSDLIKWCNKIDKFNNHNCDLNINITNRVCNG